MMRLLDLVLATALSAAVGAVTVVIGVLLFLGWSLGCEPDEGACGAAAGMAALACWPIGAILGGLAAYRLVRGAQSR